MVLRRVQERRLARPRVGVCSYGFIFVLMAFLMLSPLAFAQVPCPSIEVFFSPKGGCTDAIIREITLAKKTVLVQAYSFESVPILKVLVDSEKRGVIVSVILDKRLDGSKSRDAEFLAKHNVLVKIDRAHKKAHDKVMLVDGFVVITGSFNFSKSAEESNAENVLIIRDENLAIKYVDNWEKHWNHSKKYVREIDR